MYRRLGERPDSIESLVEFDFDHIKSPDATIFGIKNNFSISLFRKHRKLNLVKFQNLKFNAK